MDTTYPAITGSTITVASGGNIQTAIDSAAALDGNLTHLITIEAGATFTQDNLIGRVRTGANPNNTAASGWIILQSSALASLPTAGHRVAPSDAANMPKLQTTASAGAELFVFEYGAHHYRFVGLEMTTLYTSRAATQSNLILLGYNAAEVQASALADLQADIIFDRCYIHGTSTGNNLRGIAFNVVRGGVVDSYLSDWHHVGQDAQAIAAWNGPGPFKIVNNYLEGSGENVMFGGADPLIANLVPSDITIQRNYFFKPLSWYVNDASYAGVHWTVKNILEFKNARRVLVEGNLFANNWADSQVGTSIVLTPRNQNGTASWSTVNDITIRYNLLRHMAQAFNLFGTDNANASQRLTRVHIHNNLLYDINKTTFGGFGYSIWGFFCSANGADPIVGVLDGTIDHNTMDAERGVAFSDSGPTPTLCDTNVYFRNNIGTAGTSSARFNGTGTGDGDGTINAYFVTPTFTKNVLSAQSAASWTGHPGQFFPANDAAIGFTSRATRNYRLLSSSTYHNQATDGTDPGANFDTLYGTTSGVGQFSTGENDYYAITGQWPAESPPVGGGAGKAPPRRRR